MKKILLSLILISLLTGCSSERLGADPKPLKAPKGKVLFSKDNNGETTYYYVSDQVDTKLNKFNGKIKVKEENKLLGAVDGGLIEVNATNLAESFRDYNRIDYSYSPTTTVSEFYEGIAFVKNLETGEWFNLDVATSSTNDYLLNMQESAVNNIYYPNIFEVAKVYAATSTFYPDYPASVTVSGTLATANSYSTWADTRNGSGTYTDGGNVFAYLRGQGGTSYRYLQRGIMSFDISSLGSSVTINSANLSLYGLGKDTSHLTGTNDRVGITEGVMANPNALANGDYGSSNSKSTRFATDFTSSSWNTAGYNDFAINSSGLTYLDTKKTGIAIFSYRWSFDIDNTTPDTFSGDDYIQASSALAAGTSQDPKLVIVYSSGGSPAPTPVANIINFE